MLEPQFGEYSVALTEATNKVLLKHLIRTDRQEDLIFAQYTPSKGTRRATALVHTPMWPNEGDRQIHGNVSFNPQYFERTCHEAMKNGCGLVFIHSHPGSGWQGMSRDDVAAELKMAGAVLGLTDLPLIGMTTGSDGTWSARSWLPSGKREYRSRWCHSVRVIGEQLRPYFCDQLVSPPNFRETLKRTISVWGENNHAHLVRLRIGIVGLGSVGAMVAESLARMGFEHFVLIDFDEVQYHNLDRLVIADTHDVGSLKVNVAKQRIEKCATAEHVDVCAVPYSIAEEVGYRAALDCDVLFSCVDRPRARAVLNHIAYAHLIPVIDGGIAVRFKSGYFNGVDWQLQTVGPDRICLDCLGAFQVDDVEIEKAGLLDDPSYLQNLPPEHRFKRNENIFPFAANLATLEVMQLIALVTGIGSITDFGVQRFRYSPGILDSQTGQCCSSVCYMPSLIARADRDFNLFGHDINAERARQRQQLNLPTSISL